MGEPFSSSPSFNSTLLISTSKSYDTGSIGAVTEMPFFATSIGELSPFLRGFTVSLIMLTGAFPSFFAGQLADRFGGLAIVAGGALVFAIGAVLEGVAGTLVTFLVGRALCGIGEGLWLSNVSV
jgi:MFS family permease